MVAGSMHAQFRPVNDIMNLQLRERQLIGFEPLDASWLVQPLAYKHRRGTGGLTYELRCDAIQQPGVSFLRIPCGDKASVSLLDARVRSLLNTEFGFGRNLEELYPANGLSVMYSMQAHVRFGILNIQAAPEMMSIENAEFQLFPASYPDWLWNLYYREYLNWIDNPEMYREGPYAIMNLANSMVSLQYAGLELGLTTRNLWWGPGRRNSLLMSNNAPGFTHVSFHSARPLHTPIGNVEFQMIWGWLKDSGRAALPYRRFENNQPMPYIPKPDDDRMIQGLVLAWQPRWAPGLSLGAARTLVAYQGDLTDTGHYLSVFRPLFHKPEGPVEYRFTPFDPSEKFDDKMSLFFRFASPKEHLEFYGEYARSIRPWSLLDWLRFPEHTMGFTLGINKLYDLGSARYFGIEAEITQLEKQNTWKRRYYPMWYTSRTIPHGYTHKGQIMGAAIGPGSNSQYVAFNYLWNNGNRVSTFVERVIYNNDLYYILFTTSIYRLWADINFGVNADFTWNQFDFQVNAMMMRTLNYKYIETTNRPWVYEGMDLWNLNLVTTVRYRF